MQVAVIGAELIGEEHAFVDQRPAGQRHGVEADVAAAGLAVDRVGDHLAQDVEPALELDVVGDGRAPAPDEHLAVMRLGLDDGRRQAGIIGRHVAPADELEPLRLDHTRHDGLAIDALRAVLRQEDVTDAIFAGLGQLDAERLRHVLQELVRDLHENARAVAGERVRTHRAAMGQVLEDLQAMLDDGVARAAFQVGDEADATGIVLELRIVESLRRRRRRPRRINRTVRKRADCHRHLDLGRAHAPSESGARKSFGHEPDVTSGNRSELNRLLGRLMPLVRRMPGHDRSSLALGREPWSLAPQPPGQRSASLSYSPYK